MARLGKDKRFIVSTKGNEGNACTNTLEFNFRRKELSDVRVRRAIAHAINVAFFIDNFLGDFAKPATGPIPSTSTDFYPGANAALPLRQDEGGGAARRSRLQGGPRRHALLAETAARAMGRGHAAVATFIQQSLGDIGIKVEIVRNRRRRRADAGLSRGISISPRAGTSIATIPPSRRRSGIVPARPRARRGPTSGAGTTRVDKTIDQAATEIDPAKRKALYAQLVKAVNTEFPVWMPIEQFFVTAITAKARNHHNTPRWGSTSWHDTWISA